MPLPAVQKGKDSLLPSDSLEQAEISGSPSLLSVTSNSSSSPSSESESDSDTDSSEDDDENEISPEYLDSLLEKARASIAAKAAQNTSIHQGNALEDDVIRLDDPESELPCVVYFSFSIPGSHIISGIFLHLTQGLYPHPISRLGKHHMTRRQSYET
jgi:hypothetical protein